MRKAFRQLGADLRATQRDLWNAGRRTNSIIGRTIALPEARKRSSGLFKQATLAALNNPYGIGPFTPSGKRRGYLPYGDPTIVNRRTGAFYRAWRLREQPTATPVLLLVNDAPYSNYLERGTSKMIARPINVRVVTLIRELGPAIFEREFERAWRVRFDTK